MAFEHIQEKIKQLPPAARYGLLAVTAIVIYLLIRSRLKKPATGLDPLSGAFVTVLGQGSGGGGGGGGGGGTAQSGGSGSVDKPPVVKPPVDSGGGMANEPPVHKPSGTSPIGSGGGLNRDDFIYGKGGNIKSGGLTRDDFIYGRTSSVITPRIPGFTAEGTTGGFSSGPDYRAPFAQDLPLDFFGVQSGASGLLRSVPSGGAREAFTYGNPVQYPNAWRYQGGQQQGTVPRYGNMRNG